MAITMHVNSTPVNSSPVNSTIGSDAVHAVQKARLDYVQRCFQNVHELNRMMDQKANYLLAAVALMTGALAVFATAALNRKTPEEWQVYLRVGAFIALVVYLSVAFRIVLISAKVFKAHAKMLSPNTCAPGLLFPLMILNRYPDEKLYKEKVSALAYDDMIDDYSHEIVEVSNIYMLKQRDMNEATNTFHWLVWLWIMAMFLISITTFLLPA